MNPSGHMPSKVYSTLISKCSAGPARRPHVAWFPCRKTSRGKGAPLRSTGRKTRAHSSVIRRTLAGASASTTSSNEAGSLYSELVTASGPTPDASGATAPHDGKELRSNNPEARMNGPGAKKQCFCVMLASKRLTEKVYNVARRLDWLAHLYVVF